MLQSEKRPEQLNRELDRYLLSEPNSEQTLSLEDQPDLLIGVQLLQVDYSHQSRLRASLRQHLEKERGGKAQSSKQSLLHAAAKRQQRTLFGIRSSWPALLIMVIVLAAWFWTTTTRSRDVQYLHPSPIVVVTAVLSASQRTSEPDPVPIPTPFAPDSTGAYQATFTVPAAQHTPLGLFQVSPENNHP